jgi:uncharacterized phiE125 gp8 family phage protein
MVPDAIRLERPPVKSIESIKYLDVDGVEQTLVANTDFLFNLASVPPQIVPAYGQRWPIGQNYFKSVVIDYTTGYVTVPRDLARAIKLLAAVWYDNREALAHSSIDELPVPFGVSAILSSYKLRRIG